MSKLSGTFGEAADSGAVHIPFSELRTVFGLDDSRFVETEDIRTMFGNYLDTRFFLRKSENKACYRDPREIFNFSNFRDASDVEAIKASPLIATTRYKTLFGNDAMGFLIRKRIDNMKDIMCPVIFGMTGRIKPDDSLEVKSIHLPVFVKHEPKRLHRVPVTQGTVREALAYAELAIDQMFNYNIRPDFEANLEEISEALSNGRPMPSAYPGAPRL